jgi:integrase
VTQRLTQSFVDEASADGRDRIVFDSQVPGLGLRITPTGTKIFVAQARVAGQKRRITVGYAADMPLSKARAEAQQMIVAMRNGVDPTAEQRARLRAAAARSVTLRDFSERWLTEHVFPKLKPRTSQGYKEILARHILPALGNLSIAAVDREQVERLHLAMADTPRTANQAIAIVRALLGFAVQHGLRTGNPAAAIKAYRENKRERFLSEAEIGAAADAITQAESRGIGPFAAAGLRLCLFTGARSGEITSIRWDHIDWQRRLIRLPDRKTNEPRTIHLSDAAIEVLRNVPHVGPYVIAGRKYGSPFQSLSRAWHIARNYAGFDDVHLHDFRHSFASIAAGQGLSLYTIGKLLGHKNPKTTARYAHLARDVAQSANDEIGAVMQAAIEKGPQRSKVVVAYRRQRAKP